MSIMLYLIQFSKREASAPLTRHGVSATSSKRNGWRLWLFAHECFALCDSYRENARNRAWPRDGTILSTFYRRHDRTSSTNLDITKCLHVHSLFASPSQRYSFRCSLPLGSWTLNRSSYYNNLLSGRLKHTSHI